MAEFKCEDHLKCTVKCALDISCFEIEVYAFLLKNNPATTNEIASTLERDKSSVYRALQNLIKKGLVIKEYRILRQGGYVHVYRPIPFGEFREKVMGSINEWINSLLESLNNLKKLEEENLVKIL